jgi:3-phenylpropionate/cinnamic acid dioxygenase small subunit
MTDLRDDHQAITDLLVTYARACDERRWDLLDEVFTEDLDFEAGDVRSKGRQARVDSIRSNLGGCGPTQHLLGNFAISVDENDATCSTLVRAFHVGAGELQHLSYELFGAYHDRLRRTPSGWRIWHRRMEIRFELGTRQVLRPE